VFRLLSGVKKLFIFQFHEGKVSVRNDVVVTHLTSVRSSSSRTF
jgi:gamma-tubulin complex component 5